MGIMRHREISKLALGHTVLCVLGSTLRRLASESLHQPTHVHSVGQLQCPRPCLLVSRLLGSVNLPAQCALGYHHFHQTLLSATVISFPVGLSSRPVDASSSCDSAASQSFGASCTKQVLRGVRSLPSWWRVPSFPQFSVA